MIRYDFSSKMVTNTTVIGVSTGGTEQHGGVVHIPNFGKHGILVVLGGENAAETGDRPRNLIPFNSVRVYDLESDRWYEQNTSGNIPAPRMDFCVAGAASNERTYEILIYAGWDGDLGPDAIPLDEAFVLTLPGFHWVKTKYAALRPRHGLTCNAVGGGQILVIGGVDTTQKGPIDYYAEVFNTPDTFTQGLAIFDLKTLKWRSAYKSNPDVYTPASDVKEYYEMS